MPFMVELFEVAIIFPGTTKKKAGVLGYLLGSEHGTRYRTRKRETRIKLIVF